MEARITRLLADSLVPNVGGQGIGPFAVDSYVSCIFTDVTRRAWLLPPGQRPDRPSRWGNTTGTRQALAGITGLEDATRYLRSKGTNLSQIRVFEYVVRDTDGEQCSDMFMVVNNVGLGNFLEYCQ